MKRILLFLLPFISLSSYSQSLSTDKESTHSISSFHDTQGSIDVGASGQLEFTLPIALPPGIKSVAPQINLIYTSGSGNGIAGYGWNLSGITSISRMGKTIEKDGQIEGMTLSGSDFFAFNGQRLILKSGEYGKNGAEYVTEKFSNVKIKSIGSLNQNIGGVNIIGPEYWEVTFEDGSQAWYGGITSGVSNARTPIEYNIVKWKDAQGNYITYNYSQQNNVSLISSIQWGGNEALKKPHFNQIVFNYTQRSLIESSYVNGIQFIQNKILTSIQVNSDKKQFKKYVVSYDSETSYQFVKNITEYNSNNEPANPINFDYQKSVALSDQKVQEQGIKDTYTKKYGDFDFDGITDFIEIENNGTLHYKKSVYKEGESEILTYNKNEFSIQNFRNAAIITYKNKNVVGSSAGIVIPVVKYRDNSLDIYDYEFRIYAVNLKNKSLDFQYSKTLLFENFKSHNEPSVVDFNCSTQPSNITKLIPYDYNGDGISEIIADFSYNRRCFSDGEDILPFSINTDHVDNREKYEHNISPNISILQKDNTELYISKSNKENYPLLSVNDSRVSFSNHELTPISIYEHKSILFDLDQDLPYAQSFYVFNRNYNEYPQYFETTDFNGDGIEELYIENGEYLRDFININKNKNGDYFLSYKINTQSIKGLVGKAIKADFNGDGKVDIAVPQAEKSNHWKFYFATGIGFKEYDYHNFIYFSSQQEEISGSKHRNVIFEKYCHYKTINYYQYNAVDLDKDGKAEITVSKVEIVDHGWNSHSDSESTQVTFSVYSANKSNNTPIVGSTNSPLKYGLVQQKHHYFGGKVIYFSPLFINRTNQQIILIGKPEDCPTNGCDRINVVYMDYPNLPSNMRITSIEQGKVRTFISYSELLPSKYYSLSSPMAYPYISLDKVNQSYVVGNLFQEGRKQDFRYRGFVTHLQGKGMIGFRQAVRSSWYADGFENTKIWSGAEIDPLNEGLPIKEWSIKTNDEAQIFPKNLSINNNQLLSFKETKYKIDNLNGNKVKAIVPTQITTKDFIKNVVSVDQVEYDEYYLPVKTISNTNNGFAEKITTLTYYPPNLTGQGRDYFVGRPRSKEELVRAYGDSKGAKEEYEYENHLLKNKISWNQNNTGWIKESYIYDSFGNIIQKTISNSVDSQTQTAKTEYDKIGKFVIKKTDNLGLSTLIEYNSWGQITKETDPFGNVLTNTYDAWGKLLTSKTNLEGTTSYTYEKLSDGGAKVTEYSPIGNQTITYTNKIGQSYKATSKAFNEGKFVSKETLYDTLGRKVAESEPFFENERANQWNRIEYDEFSRPIKATAFTGKIVETQYKGNEVKVIETNANNRFKKQIFDALGNIASTEDLGGTIVFKYNANGQNIEAKYGNNIVTTKYDVWGRKIEFHDPSNGIYRYQYNGFGTLIKEVSPKGYKEYTYNQQGQLISQREITTDGTQNTDKSISYTYNNKGLIVSKKGNSKGKPFGIHITYDNYGRPTSTSEHSYGKYYMQKGIIYDDTNRIASYEKGLYSSGVYTSVKIRNNYSQWDGSLQSIEDQNTGDLLWRTNSTNAKGQVSNAYLGGTTIVNEYDNNGFLENINHSTSAKTILQIHYRFDAIKNELRTRNTGGDFTISESFTYDNLNRLVEWTNPKTGTFHRNIYDKQGRITDNDQLGKVTFGNTGKIYQPSGIELNAQGQQNLTNNFIQHIAYNENNDPIFIDGEKGDVRFEYGLTEMRQMVTFGGNISDQNNGQGKYTRYYSEDGSYEITVDNRTGEEKHILYIGGNPYESNVIFVKDYKETAGSFKFLHKDYLGSILAITDRIGNKIEQRHYDAWGNLTHLQIGNGEILTGSQLPTAYGLLLIDRGYTSHEHLFEVGIIHMNGRLYDPLLRRFLNADENIQDPHNTQNYNKYGYVLNNPLMYNDPSGEFIFTALATWLGSKLLASVVIGAAISVASYTIGLAVTGNIHQWSIGGALKAAFWGAVGGAASFGVGEIFSIASQGGKLTQIGTFLKNNIGKVGLSIVQAGTHAVSQGVLSVMQGGSFEQAFWSGALGSLGASGWRAVMGTSGGAMVAFGAISGGIGAELSGGNFWQGAVIGGTVAWLNHAMHRENDDEWMLTKDGRIIKVGNRGGNKTDYLYDEFTYAQTIESRTLLATADVQHSTVTTGYFSSGGYPVQEGFGYRLHTQFGGHSLYDPSFDIMSSYVGGGALKGGLKYFGGKYAFTSKLFGYQSKLFGRYALSGHQGYLNRSHIIRTGWGWNNKIGNHVFRTSIGKPTGKNIHIDWFYKNIIFLLSSLSGFRRFQKKLKGIGYFLKKNKIQLSLYEMCRLLARIDHKLVGKGSFIEISINRYNNIYILFELKSEKSINISFFYSDVFFELYVDGIAVMDYEDKNFSIKKIEDFFTCDISVLNYYNKNNFLMRSVFKNQNDKVIHKDTEIRYYWNRVTKIEENNYTAWVVEEEIDGNVSK